VRRRCDACGAPYEAQRATSKYCHQRCRVRASNVRKSGRQARPREAVVSTLPPADQPGDGPAAAAVRRKLTEVGRLETYLGATALALAGQIDAGASVGLTGLARQLQATMGAVLEGAQSTTDLVDDLKARRARRHAG
jgi:hypothetical protein